MTPLLARLSAATIVFVSAVAIAALWITSSPGLSGTPVKAEFRDAYPLLPGMFVRVQGAVAGTVADVELTDEGLALVTIQLNDGTDPPRADATASIRQQDITGDSYVSLGLGDDSEPLGDAVIPPDRTLVTPRFDDLLNSFDEPVREGLEFTLVELGKALDRRGDDLNEAALYLRPGLAAANQALAELRSQNRALGQLVENAEAVTGQAASRSDELAKLIESLAVTGRTVAAEGPELDAALALAPETNSKAQVTLAKLANAAEAGIPLAQTLQRAAPDLAMNAQLSGPFLEDVRATLLDATPTVKLTRELLQASLPTLKAAPKRVLTAPFDLAASVGALLDLILGDPELGKGLFGADTYGEGPGLESEVGLGSVGVETGEQDGYDGNDPQRYFLRAVAVPSCEMFGLPIAPGCLLDFLTNAQKTSGTPEADGSSKQQGGGGDHGGGADQGGGDGPLGGLGDLGNLGNGVDDLLDDLTGPLGLPKGGSGGKGGKDGKGLQGVNDLLDFILGP